MSDFAVVIVTEWDFGHTLEGSLWSDRVTHTERGAGARTQEVDLCFGASRTCRQDNSCLMTWTRLGRARLWSACRARERERARERARESKRERERVSERENQCDCFTTVPVAWGVGAALSGGSRQTTWHLLKSPRAPREKPGDGVWRRGAVRRGAVWRGRDTAWRGRTL